MIDTAALHDDAMEAADAGDRARRAGDHDSARVQFCRALAMERTAAEAEHTQPSRAILFRSAAWLALEAEDAMEAERLASAGLADREVPDRLRFELRAVAEEARMRIVGAFPPPSAVSSLALHLDGPGIGYGLAEPVDVLSRASALLSVVYRSAERLANEPFRKRGQPSVAVREQVQPRLEFAAASVVVRIQLGGTQASLWDANVRLVEDVRRCFDAVAADSAELLRALIPDDLYRANFEALVAKLAPDGERVSAVDLLGASTGRTLVPVRLRPRQRHTRGGAGDTEVDAIVGEIRAADETSRTDTIRLVTREGLTLTFEVNEAVMEDIVRPYYGQRVRVRGRHKKANRWVMLGEPELVDDGGDLSAHTGARDSDG